MVERIGTPGAQTSTWSLNVEKSALALLNMLVGRWVPMSREGIHSLVLISSANAHDGVEGGRILVCGLVRVAC